MKFFTGAVNGLVFGFGVFLIGRLLSTFGMEIGPIAQVPLWLFTISNIVIWMIMNVVINTIRAGWLSFSNTTKTIILVAAIFMGASIIAGLCWLLGQIIYIIVVFVICCAYIWLLKLL